MYVVPFRPEKLFQPVRSQAEFNFQLTGSRSARARARMSSLKNIFSRKATRLRQLTNLNPEKKFQLRKDTIMQMLKGYSNDLRG